MEKLKPWYYEQANFFGALNAEEIRHIEKFSTTSSYKKGSLICSLGNLCEYVYVLKKGTIKVFLLTSDGKETILAIRKPGNIIGLTALFGWPRRVSYVAALSDVEVLKARTEDMRSIVLNSRNLAESVIKILCARLHHSRRVIYDLSTKSVKDRLIRFILDLADDVGIPDGDAVVINLELTHELISQMIASSRQSVTVFLNDLEKREIISKSQKKLTIKDPKALMNLIKGADSRWG